MDYVIRTYELFGPFWPTLAIVLIVLLSSLGTWMVVSTWRHNRRMDELQQTLKRNVHAARN